jgi:membrane protein HdeD
MACQFKWFRISSKLNEMAVPSSNGLRIVTALLLLVAGAASIVFPFLSAAAVTLVFGAVAMAAGVSQLLRFGAASDLGAKIFRLLSALLYVVGGIYVLLFPVDSTFSITLFLGVLLVVEGVMELAAAAAAAGPARNLVLLDGIITCLLGGMVLVEWPSDTVWVIGTLFGMALLFSAFRMFASSGGESPQTNS